MELSTAIRLIEEGLDKNASQQAWADLGAGSGLFSQALASILNSGSVIHAIDKAALKKIKSPKSSVEIRAERMDFATAPLKLDLLDGILMANSIHYVEDKFLLMERLKKNLNDTGRIIIVEYDMELSNAWVPYPIPFSNLVTLCKKCGVSFIAKLQEVPSQYHTAMIYSALLKF
jgi:hypothetical protein